MSRNQTQLSRSPRAWRWSVLACTAVALVACDAEPEDEHDLAMLELSDEDLDDSESVEGLTSGGEVDVVQVEEFDEDDDESPDWDADADSLAPDSVGPLEIGAVSVWSWGTPGNSGADLDMGSTSGRTCFLTGVTGDLEGKWKGPSAGVWVFKSGGRWKLRTRAGVGTGVMGHAACIPTDFNQVSLVWPGNSENSNNKKVYPLSGPRSGFTQCFLTSVTGTDGWKSPNSWAGLKKENIWENGAMTPKWTLSGNLLWEQDNTAGGGASAVCVDIWQTLTNWSWVPSSGSPPVTGNLGSTTNRVCSIHRLKGNLAAAPGGWLDGLRMFISGGNWQVISQSGKAGWGECLNNIVWGW